jgi:hypothetical protein
MLRAFAGVRREVRYLSSILAATALVLAFAGDGRFTPTKMLTPHGAVIVNSVGCRFGYPSVLVVCRSVSHQPSALDVLASRRARPLP